MLAAFGGVTWAAWTENLPIGTGWRERLLIKLVGESGVFKAYLIFGGVGVLFSLGMLVWGIILLF
jgi:hypothetical protein